MNINGVTILKQTIETFNQYGNWQLFPSAIIWFILGLILVLGTVFLAVYLSNKDREILSFLTVVVGAAFAGLIFVNGIFSGENIISTYEVNTYFITVEETVPFHELMDNYEFVSQDGKIFVFQDKIPEN